MGHRHLFNPSQVFEIGNDQSWNHVHSEQTYMHLARAGAAENGSVVCPVENVPFDGVNYASYWNPVPRSNGFASTNQSIQMSHYQPDVSGRSLDPFLPPHAAGSFSMVPNNYTHNASSSSHGAQTFHGAEDGFIDVTMASSRGPYKRKSPGVPAVCEGGSTSRYSNVGSSSDVSMSSDTWQEKPNTGSQYKHWDCPPAGSSFRGNGLSIGGEGTLRNVRSRLTLDLETNLDRTHLSSNPSHHAYNTSYVVDHSSPVEHFGQSSNSSIQELNNLHMAPAAQGRILLSDANIFSQDTSHFIVGSSNHNASAETRSYHNDFISSSTPVPQNLQGITNQPVREARNSYNQRSAPAFRASSSNLRLGCPAAADGSLQLVAASHSSRHSRAFPSTGWRNNERSGRTRISSERYRSLYDETVLHEHFVPEGLMDHSGFYGSRNLFDQHGNLRLDIDNMSYEELLALGERIGHVNTGLSEDMITKSLTESIYCSSDQCQEEGKCVICLEEYQNMDDVGTLKACRHDFHVSCIKKWLSMKNSCPICKTAALADHLKEQ